MLRRRLEHRDVVTSGAGGIGWDICVAPAVSTVAKAQRVGLRVS